MPQHPGNELMRIFLSYSRCEERIAEEVQLALLAEGHSVFFDRSGLPSGETFHATIRQEIAAADVFVFLISPSSVRPGCYALAAVHVPSVLSPARHA